MVFITGHKQVKKTCEYLCISFLVVLPDVWLTGGAEYFKSPKSLNGNDYYQDFQKKGYNLVFDKKALLKNKKKDDKLMGIFRTGNLNV